MPSVVLEERSHTDYVKPGSPYETREIKRVVSESLDRPYGRSPKDITSKDDLSRSTGKPSDGVSSMPLTNGYLPDGLSQDKASVRSSGLDSVVNGRDSYNEYISRQDNDATPSDTLTRDDGLFAQQGEAKERRFGSTRVVLNSTLGSTDGTSESKLTSTRDLSGKTDGDKSSLAPRTQAPVEAAYNTINGTLRVPSGNAAPAHRLSSPPALSQPTSSSSAAPSIASTALQPPENRLQQRHTLEVPKVTSTRGSREFPSPNPSEEVVTATGRFSPNTPTRRRASMTLTRRGTRSIHSELHLDEVPQDEDAARWADHIKAKRASKRKRKEEEDDDRVVVGTKVDQNHVNWVTAYNMLTGIRFTVSRINAKMDRPLTDADFEAKHKFSFDITGNELTPSAKYDFKFKDYAPWVFRHLRSIFRLDPADYLMSLTSKYILSELGSPGKSGSFFYFSRDYKYIIKTIHHAEHKFLRKILKDYYNHVKENPNTLLSQFYGLHRVKIPYGRKIHFVVMNNLFPPHRDIHRTFDLKGSTIGRDFREEDLEKNPRATLKDLNWLRRNLHLEFGPVKRKAFIEQMEKDVKLLQRLKIMDYSLLVGIHDLERGNEENLRDKTLQVFQPGGEDAEDPVQANMLMRTPSKLESQRKAKELRQMIKNQKPVPMDQTSSKMPDEVQEERKSFYFYSDDGGFRATHEDNREGEEIYYLGIIDCLTHYSFIKRAEHFFKGLTHPESQISAIPPERYGERFIRFISGITKSREAAEREKFEQENFVDDPRLSGVNIQRTPTDDVMEKAEKQAEKSKKKGANEDHVPERSIHAIRSPSAERGENGGYTLPVVEEAVESGSTGERSEAPSPQPPTEGNSGAAAQTTLPQRPPPTPPKDPRDGRPATPPKDDFMRQRTSGPPTPPKDGKMPTGKNSLEMDKALPPPPAQYSAYIR